MDARITAQEFLDLIHTTLPGSSDLGLRVDALGAGLARVRLAYDPKQLRAGGTLSGPTVMALADTALYAMVLSVVGLEPLAVTTDLSFHFLKKPAQRDLVAEARLLKHGRKLVVGDVVLRSDGEAEPVAHAIGTYALPSSPSKR